jgi:hypothetical protein
MKRFVSSESASSASAALFGLEIRRENPGRPRPGLRRRAVRFVGWSRKCWRRAESLIPQRPGTETARCRYSACVTSCHHPPVTCYGPFHAGEMGETISPKCHFHGRRLPLYFGPKTLPG